MGETQKWYLVYTRPGFEKKFSEILSRRGIENYCPLNTVVQSLNNNRKPVQEALFNSFVFLRITEKEISHVRQINGVINLVYWLGKPAVIDHSEIAAIKDFLKEHNTVRLEKTEVNANSKARIYVHPHKGSKDHLTVSKNKLIKLLLPSLGYFMVAEIEITTVEVFLTKP